MIERVRQAVAWVNERSAGVLGDSLVYALPSVASAALGLLLTPLVTRRLTLGEYGQLENFNVLVGSLSVVAGLNLAAATAVLLRTGQHDDTSKRVVSSVAALSVVSVLFVSIAIGLFGDSLGRFLGWGSRSGDLASIAVASSAAAAFLSVVQATLRQRFEKKKSLIVSLVGPFAYGTLAVLLVGLAKGGLGSLLVALVVGPFIALLLGAAFVRRDLHWASISRQTMVAALRISMPFCVAGWAALVTKSADRFLLMAWVSEPLEKIALYAAAEKLLIPILLVSQGFGIAFPPIAMKLARSNDPATGLRTVYAGYVGVSAMLMVVATALSPLVAFVLLPPTFHGAVELVPGVSFYLAIGYLFYVFSGGLLVTGQTQWITVAAVAGAVCNIALNASWIPLFGIKGAIWATNVATMVYALLVAAAAEKVFPVGYPLRLAALAYATSYALAELSLLGVFWAGCAIVLQVGVLGMLQMAFRTRPAALSGTRD